MDLSRQLRKTWRETVELLEDEDELVMQLAYNQIKPMEDWWEMWACLFESQVQEQGKKFNHQRWIPGEKSPPKPVDSETIKKRMSVLRA